MLKKLLDIFAKKPAKKEAKHLPLITSDKQGQAIKDADIIAVSVILVHIASSDDQVANEEAQTICELLAYNFELPENRIPEVVDQAILQRREAGKIEDFVSQINSTFGIEQRLRILAMAWKLVLSDSKVEKPEEKLMIRLATDLYLSIHQQETARQYAENGMV